MKTKYFRYLWCGQLFANTGDTFYIIGLISMIYATTGSVFMMSLVPFVTTVFRFVSSLLSPLIIDRFKLKAILVHSQLWKTVLLMLLTLVILFNLENIYVIFFFVMLISLLDGVAGPVSSSLVPMLVKEEERVKANGLMSILNQTVMLLSWPLGGVLIGIVGSANLFFLTVLLFFVSTILNALIRVVETIEENGVKENKMESIKSGWKTIWHTPSLRTIMGIDTITCISNGVWIAAILYIYVENVLHVGTEWWTYINTGYFAGMIIGGFISLKISSIISKYPSRAIIVGAFLTACFTLLFGFTTIPVIAVIISALIGIPGQVWEIASTTIIQDSASEKMLTKVYAAFGVVIYLTFGISTLLLGYITEQFGVRVTFVFSATLLCVSGLIALKNKKVLVRQKEQEESEIVSF